MDRIVWQATVHRITKESGATYRLNIHTGTLPVYYSRLFISSPMSSDLFRIWDICPRAVRTHDIKVTFD